MARRSGGRNNNAGGGPRRRFVAALRARKVVELYAQHYGTNAEIGAHPEVGLTSQRVGQIIQETQADLREEKRDLAEYAITQRLDNFREIKRVTREVMMKACMVCEGAGSLSGAPCETCLATGWFYESERRLAAASQYGRTLMDEAKLLGEFEPDKTEITINAQFIQDLASLSEDQLDRFIELYEDDDGVFRHVPEQPSLEAAPRLLEP